ncbi:hypothetical protein [Streptomyces sp. C10-9-1]|uniref:hypothetical protein n=1 Tax=Streptomyces sp. C10-9-1 TaxID=1859285 RepID=UPI003F4A159C
MSPHLTPLDVILLAGIGGFAALLLAAGFSLLAFVLYRAFLRLDDRLQRRRDLQTCLAINALDTTTGDRP